MLTWDKKFWEELIVYIPFTLISVSDTCRKKLLVFMHNEVNKTMQLGRLQCGYSVGNTGGSNL
jgi:hypothetical protein